MSSTLVVFSLYFVAIIGLTLYASTKMLKTSRADFASEYFVGGRNIGPLALAILVAAGVCSTGTFIGAPGLAGENGWGFIILFGFGQLVMNLFILGIVGKKINIVSRRINAQSYLDLFYYRFAAYKPLILLLLLALLVFLVTAASAEFIGGSRVIQSMAGIPFTYSLIGFGAIIVAYTALGGLRGVTTIAMMQGIIMTLASVILIVAFIAHFGGVTQIFEASVALDPVRSSPGGTEPLYTMIDYWFTYGIGVLGLAWGVQGALSYGSVKTMKTAIVAGIVMVSFWSVFMGLGGVAGKVLFPDLASSDLLIPKLTEAVVPGALSGFVLAAVAGAGQSTIGALFILASSSIVITGFRLIRTTQATSRSIQLSSIIVTVVVGIAVLALAFNPPATLQDFITLSQGGSAAALAPILILGLYWPRMNKYGALAALIAGFASYFIIGGVDFGVEWLSNLPLIVSAPIAFVVAFAVSLATPPPSRGVIEVFFAARPSSGVWLSDDSPKDREQIN